MSAAPKSEASKTKPTHPPRPKPGKLDIAAAHKSIVRRYPKVLAELAKWSRSGSTPPKSSS